MRERPSDDLRDRLRRVDGRGYAAYREIVGTYDFGDFSVTIDRTQRDPFAPPTAVRVFVPHASAGFEDSAMANRSRRIALCDYLTRRLGDAIAMHTRGSRGSGNSGVVTVARPGQEIVERTSVLVHEDAIEARLYVGLPARARRIAGRAAESVLLEELPTIVDAALMADALDGGDLTRHLDANEDQDTLRERLDALCLVAFVADGSILPRRSGADDRPMPSDEAVAFRSPDSLRIDVDLPHAGKVTGMGLPRGVTLIVGGGYHGKSTLLQAIGRGVYNHIPGDGRELVATVSDAVKVRAEEGRHVSRVDLRPFIRDLPGNRRADAFTTDDASGSTSQAAAVVEALEMGASALLLDEDTSATNFLIRDERMAQLVSNDAEPIRPLSQHIRRLAREGVSTVLVMGGSGAYFGLADRVLRVTEYVVEDVTAAARSIAERKPNGEIDEEAISTGRAERIPVDWDVEQRGRVRVSLRGDVLRIGREDVRLEGLESLCVEDQAETLGRILVEQRGDIGDGSDLVAIVRRMEKQVDEEGLDAVAGRRSGRHVRPRSLEIAGVLNRSRKLRFSGDA